MTLAEWNTPHVVYIKFTDQAAFQDKIYVGSTQGDVSDQERNRYRKMLQVQRQTLVSAEMAARWRAQSTSPSHPSISSHHTTTCVSWNKPFLQITQAALTGTFRRHSEHAHLQNQTCHLDFPDQPSSNTAKSFDATSQHFPSHHFTDWRPTCPSQVPHAASVAFKTLKKRGIPLPRPAAPLSVPHLQHEQYHHDLITGLKQIYREFQSAAPLHSVPSFKIVHHKNCHVAEVFAQFSDCPKPMGTRHTTVCTCATWRSHLGHDHHDFFNGHVACPGAALALPPHLHIVTSGRSLPPLGTDTRDDMASRRSRSTPSHGLLPRHFPPDVAKRVAQIRRLQGDRRQQPLATPR